MTIKTKTIFIKVKKERINEIKDGKMLMDVEAG